MDMIENDHLRILCTPYCAAIHCIYSKKHGRSISLVLPSESDHATSPTYSGNTIFPFAGRIPGAFFNGLELDRNDGMNSLHGGFGPRAAIFERCSATSGRIEYRLSRKRGDDRLPVEREYRTGFSLDGNAISIDLSMEAERPVLADMTSHLYFNLSGERTIRNHMLSIDAEKCVLNNEDHTAREIIDVAGTAMDFRTPRRLSEIMDEPFLAFSHGLNNAFILGKDHAAALSADGMKLTGISDSAAVVIYTGGFLDPPSSYIAMEFQDIPVNSCRTVADRTSRHIEFIVE